MENHKQQVENLLTQEEVMPILDDNLNDKSIVFDLSEKNLDLKLYLKQNPGMFNYWSQSMLKKHEAKRAIGKCFEERIIYTQDLFREKIIRCIHLGIDISGSEKEKIYSPLDAKVHSMQDNIGEGDYGPTIILQHDIKNTIFYTLYGHLSKDSLTNLSPGDEIKKGEFFATLGGIHENGGYNPHLHFQVITDLLGKKGDFPGVCMKEDFCKYEKICIDPNLILKIQNLKSNHLS